MAPDDLKVGQYVTVLDWFENREPPKQWLEPTVMGLQIRSAVKRLEYKGVVLKIEALSLPYVICRVGFGAEIAILDTRLLELGALTDGFVQFMRAEWDRRQPRFKNADSITLGLHDQIRVEFTAPLSLADGVMEIIREIEDDEKDE